MTTPIVIKHCVIPDEELEIVRRLSIEYASEYSQASDPARYCPKAPSYEDLEDESRKLANADAMLEGFKMLWANPQQDVVEEVPNK